MLCCTCQGRLFSCQEGCLEDGAQVSALLQHCLGWDVKNSSNAHWFPGPACIQHQPTWEIKGMSLHLNLGLLWCPSFRAPHGIGLLVTSPLLTPAAVFPSQVLVLRRLLSKASHASLYLSGLPLGTPNLVQLNSHSTGNKTKAERCEQDVLCLAERKGVGQDTKVTWMLRCSMVPNRFKSRLLGKQLILEFSFPIQESKRRKTVSLQAWACSWDILPLSPMPWPPM